MSVTFNPVRIRWTFAFLLLLLIWSVWFIRMPTGTHSQDTAQDAIEGTKQTIDNPNQNPELASAPPKPVNMPSEDAHIEASEPAKNPVKGGGTKADGDVASSIPTDRPLILYAYSETPNARSNLIFFLAHGLHQSADFVFIINGESDATSLIPEQPYITIVKRPNDCYDLGAHAEVLIKDDLYKKHKRFILMNASIRGPFLPSWAAGCWSDMYLGKITDNVKLVGMTGNCEPIFHVQSMIWATDSIGIDLLLHPPPNPDLKDGEEPEVGINGCFHTWERAVHAEIFATRIILDAGYNATVMMSAFHAKKNFIETCDTGGNGDALWNGKYYGTNMHPYETVFMKANRDIEPILMDRLTEWADGSGYSSYDYC